MKTILEFISENDLKIGELVTNGAITWEITEKSNGSFYLRDVDGYSHISGSGCKLASIPNLRPAPSIVKEYRFAVKLLNEDPKTEWFQDSREAIEKYGKRLEDARKLSGSREVIKYKDGKIFVVDDENTP
jgi:hypothetical protein